jgi:hypothetical protein
MSIQSKLTFTREKVLFNAMETAMVGSGWVCSCRTDVD